MAIEGAPVTHTYAGILGPLAFLTAITRGVIHGGSTVSILLTAWCCLLAFSAIGYVLGWVAGQIVADSVRTALLDELEGK